MSTSSASIAESDISASTTPSSPATTISSEDPRSEEAPPWILHHILHPECAAELPLTTMFSFNAGQKPSSLHDAQAWWQLDPEGTLLRSVISSLTEKGPWKEEKEDRHGGAEKHDLETIPENVTEPIGHPLDHHMDPLHAPTLRKVRFVDPPPPDPDAPGRAVFDKYKKKPEPVTGLPYEFVKSFCLKAFPPEYESADFSNPLKALDYLRDLEFTRRAKLREAGRKWGVTEFTWRHEFTANPRSYDWYLRMQHVETELAKWFAQVYVGLRIWIMINELKQVFNSRQELLAMLNTLYPPIILSVPNDQISIKQLHYHRSVIFGWILALEKSGTPESIISIEDTLLKGKYSWRKVTLSLENYLKHTKAQIDFASSLPETAKPPVILPDIPDINDSTPIKAPPRTYKPKSQSPKPKLRLITSSKSSPNSGQSPHSPKPLGFFPPPLPDPLPGEEEEEATLVPRPLFFSSSPPRPRPASSSVSASPPLDFLGTDPFKSPESKGSLRKQSSLGSLRSRFRREVGVGGAEEKEKKERHDSKFGPEAITGTTSLELRKKRSFSFLSKMSGRGKEKEKEESPLPSAPPPPVPVNFPSGFVVGSGGGVGGFERYTPTSPLANEFRLDGDIRGEMGQGEEKSYFLVEDEEKDEEGRRWFGLGMGMGMGRKGSDGEGKRLRRKKSVVGGGDK